MQHSAGVLEHQLPMWASCASCPPPPHPTFLVLIQHSCLCSCFHSRKWNPGTVQQKAFGQPLSAAALVFLLYRITSMKISTWKESILWWREGWFYVLRFGFRGIQLCARRHSGWFHFPVWPKHPQSLFLQSCRSGKGCFCDSWQAAEFLRSGESRSRVFLIIWTCSYSDLTNSPGSACLPCLG